MSRCSGYLSKGALLIGLLCLGFPSFAGETAKPKNLPTLIVFDIVNERGVDKSMANLITELVLDNVSKLGKYTVLGQKDLDKLMGWEQKKQMQGCSDTGCLVQIAGALGAAFYIEGSIGVMGDLYLVSLKLIDANSVKVMQRSTEKVAKAENVVVVTIEKQVAGLFGESGAVPASSGVTAKGGVTSPLQKTVETPTKPLVKWGMGLTFSGVGVAAIGGVMTALAFKTSDDYKSEKDPKKMQDLKSSIDSYNGAAIGMYAVGGAAAVTGVVLWVLGAMDKPKKVSFAPMVAPGFGGMAVGGEW